MKKHEGASNKVLRITTFADGNAYIIIYVSDKNKYESYLPIAEKIIDSLKINAQQIQKEPMKDASRQYQSNAKKSYQLIVYLDGASQQNAIGDNFKVVIYNARNESIFSAKPIIDFKDSHQKISPKDGYPINYQLGQQPKDIKVCAQQEYSVNEQSYLHDDCYPIKQNIQKTYWYTTFDYGQIDGFEADTTKLLKSTSLGSVSSTVTIKNGASSPSNGKFFVPETLTVSKGTIVKWKNLDDTMHTVTSGKAEGGKSGTIFDSGYLVVGKTFEWKFNNAGTFDYYCTLHPYMKGRILVK